jgi:hypothetical protein
VVLGDGSRCAECTATVVRRDAKGVGIEWADAVSGSVCDALGCRASCPFAEDHA